MNLRTLRNRAADLTFNTPLGAAAIQTLLSGVISTGLQIFPQPKFQELGMTAEQARAWSRKVKLEFEMWASSLEADFYRRNNFYELQRIAFLSYLIDGDCWCLFKRRANAPYTLKLQLLEAQRISNPLPEGSLINSVEMQYKKNRIVNGVEVDKQGQLVAVWISNRIWNEPSTDPEVHWQRVKMTGENGYRNVLQICYDTNPQQYRGAPLLSSVIESLKQVSRYADAELTSSIIKSFFSLFFVQPNSNFDLNQMLPQEELDVREYTLGSGTISALPRGVDVRSVESNNSQSTFDAFMTHFVKQIGSAMGIPAELLLKQFTNSYSASRAALLEADKLFRQRRAAFVNDFCQPVYQNFILEAVARGRIDAPGFFNDAFKKYCWSAADWRTEVTGSIDPVKDVNAAKTRIELGISTREIEATKIGNDFAEVSEQLKLENSYTKSLYNENA